LQIIVYDGRPQNSAIGNRELRQMLVAAVSDGGHEDGEPSSVDDQYTVRSDAISPSARKVAARVMRSMN